ncbi:MerC domain-containing protein [Spirosoma sp.]|uniref:MerC domain-containing protein n=1 Tax=Spirosoma sp. TaxID=1899569 RepID=UPI003B3BD464
MKTDILSRKADYIGITGSVLCIIHCLITPILLMTTALMQDEKLRVGYLSLDYVFIGVNIIAVYFATRHYAPPVIKKSLWGFLGLFTIALLLEEVNPAFEYLAYVASFGLVTSHLFNIRQHRLSHAH